jgi:hypothetical protein
LFFAGKLFSLSIYMENRREQKRYPLTESWTVSDKRTGRFLGQVANISSAGLLLTGEYPIEVGRVLELHMEFPRELGGWKTVDFQAQSQWVGDRQNGFKLVNLSLDEALLFGLLIQEFGDPSTAHPNTNGKEAFPKRGRSF